MITTITQLPKINTTITYNNVSFSPTTLTKSYTLATIINVGPKGDKGQDGLGATSVPTQINQSSPSTAWIVNHNLGYRPQVSVYNSGGQEVMAEVIHTSTNQYQVLFDNSSSGFTIYQ